MPKNIWEVTEELNASDLRRERIPPFLFQVADFLLRARSFTGTVTELLAAVGETNLKPNIASKLLTKYYNEVFRPLGIRMDSKKTAAARLIFLQLDDGTDGNDSAEGYEKLLSLRQEND